MSPTLTQIGALLLPRRPAPGFVPTHVLHARGTSPFGQFLSDTDLLRIWEENGGVDEPAPWFLMGSRDTPTGTLWHLAFAPPRRAEDLQATRELDVLPEALWIHHLQGRHPSSGWVVQETPAGSDLWLGLWEGQRCVRLACLSRPEDIAAELAWQERRFPESLGAPRVQAPLRRPTPKQLTALLDENPQAQLLPETMRQERKLERALQRSRKGTLAAFALLVLVSLGLWGVRTLALRTLESTCERTRSLAPVLMRLERLGQAHDRDVQLLNARPQLLTSNPATSRWLADILRATQGAHLESLRLEGGDSSLVSVRMDLEVQAWSELNPLLERLQKVPGVKAARFGQQSRQENKVRAQATLEGTLP